MRSGSPARQRSELEGGLDYAAVGAFTIVSIVVVLRDPKYGRSNRDIIGNTEPVKQFIHVTRGVLEWC